MSSTRKAEFLRARSGREQAFFWIAHVDENGFEVDRRFAEAAYERVCDFRFYRAHELSDEAVRANLVEKAVYAASRAQKSEPVRDIRSYIFATFTRLVDECIAKEPDVDQAPSSELERVQERRAAFNPQRPTKIENAIVRHQVLAAMSAKDRYIWERRLLGYRVQQIAGDMNVSVKCISMRMRRAVDRVAETLRLRPAGQ